MTPEEFDRYVEQYIEYIDGLTSYKPQRRTLNIFAYLFSRPKIPEDPIYSNPNLKEHEKRAICLASDWKRIEGDLERVIKDPGALPLAKRMISESYDLYRKVCTTDE